MKSTRDKKKIILIGCGILAVIMLMVITYSIGDAVGRTSNVAKELRSEVSSNLIVWGSNYIYFPSYIRASMILLLGGIAIGIAFNGLSIIRICLKTSQRFQISAIPKDLPRQNESKQHTHL